MDIHSASQAVVTLVQLEEYGADQDLCRRVVDWMINNMQSKNGKFYYQKGKYLTNRIPYMRWGQAWAFHALAAYLAAHGQ